MIVYRYSRDCQEAPALLWQQEMRVGLFWLGCGQSGALWGKTRAGQDGETWLSYRLNDVGRYVRVQPEIKTT